MGDAQVSGTNSCFRCGTEFPEGGVRYRVDIRVAADTGGVVSDVEDLNKELETLLDVIKGKDETELEQEVHQSFRFYLCRPCRDDYLKGPEIPLSNFFFGE